MSLGTDPAQFHAGSNQDASLRDLGTLPCQNLTNKTSKACFVTEFLAEQDGKGFCPLEA